MNRIFLMIIFSIALIGKVEAQDDKYYPDVEDYFKTQDKEHWHGYGTKGLEIGGGIADQTQFVSFYGSSYLGMKTYLKVGGMYEFGNIKDVDYSAIYLDASFNIQVFRLWRVLYVNLTAGASGVYDEIKPDLQEQLDHDFSSFNGWNYGVFGGGEADVFLGKRIAALAFANQRFYFKDGFGTERFFVGVGLKYTFKE
ncbi:hypothetical protein [Flexithrix dorotheae]|uniref:hypothetical protein n=1 Tax=Flexithrix dorotheae TaxID=70993 RepID=UPI00039C3399|nr:hypothetical protein [Flexithrix dorotheae]